MTEQTAEQPEIQVPAFTPEDLVAAVGLIDEAVNQGSYKGWEMIQRASQVRTRVLLFAQHWQKTIQSATDEALAAATAGATEAVTPAATDGEAK